MSDEDICKLLKVANNYHDKIKIAYEVAENNSKPIDNLYSFLKDAIEKGYKPPVKKVNDKKGFNNFQQRDDWDFDMKN